MKAVVVGWSSLPISIISVCIENSCMEMPCANASTAFVWPLPKTSERINIFFCITFPFFLRSYDSNMYDLPSNTFLKKEVRRSHMGDSCIAYRAVGKNYMEERWQGEMNLYFFMMNTMSGNGKGLHQSKLKGTCFPHLNSHDLS